MTETQRADFDNGLDVLAATLGSKPISAEAKEQYWKALAGHNFELFMQAIEHLRAHFKPRWRDHFPAPAEISDAVSIMLARKQPDPPNKDYEAIKAGFKRRGILIGEEARIRLEEDWNRRMKTAREGLAQDDPADYQA